MKMEDGCEQQMVQKEYVAEWDGAQKHESHGPISKSMTITVFTSQNCPFCGEAVRVVREVARNLDIYETSVSVIESLVEAEPSMVEDLSVLTVPTTVIGNSRIVGLPDENEVENLIHQAMLAAFMNVQSDHKDSG
ncbi:MAG: thioredoxin family protein [Candidatus Thorarchaeota archaeon]